VFCVDSVRKALLDHLTYVEICQFTRVSVDTKEWSRTARKEMGLCDEKGVPVSEVRAAAVLLTRL